MTISYASVAVIFNVSETCCVSVINVGMENDHKLMVSVTSDHAICIP